MMVFAKSSIHLKLAAATALLAAILVSCHGLAQDAPPDPRKSPAAADSGSAAQPAGGNAGANSQSGTAPENAAPAGIPTDPLGIADAMGRPFTAAFIAASIIGVWSVIERLVVLRRRRVIPKAFVERFLMHLRAGRMDKTEAISVCQQNESPMADVFLHGVRKWGRPSVEVEQAVLDGGERQISQLKKGLRVLNGVSTLSPLIGLLGTVVGMIRSFNDIATAGAMGQTQTLANGIALALLTTAVGLLIAIPAMAAYLYLAGKVDSLVMEMDRLGQELVNLISAEALRDRAVLAPPPAPAALPPVEQPPRTRKPVPEK
ncbi:MAG: MotA/TolQ/ExbB proton channel family protein [Planctomycetaceae bacterium]|nr:MotA/TolQ/ExbB proton channel family protein [Planctomycetaceae bacterium]